MSVRNGLASVYRVLIVVAVVAGILLQCGIGTVEFSLSSFRMFTTLSNLAVAVFYVVYIAARGGQRRGVNSYSSVRSPSHPIGWEAGRSVRGVSRGTARVLGYFKFMITLSIMLTGLVAHFMLRNLFVDMGSEAKAGLTLLHYVVPIMVVCDWIIFDEKGKTEWKMPPFAALFPIIYATVTLIAAQFSTAEDKYPYPFLNVDALGAGGVAVNIVLLAVAFLAVGYAGVALDRRLGREG